MTARIRAILTIYIQDGGKSRTFLKTSRLFFLFHCKYLCLSFGFSYYMGAGEKHQRRELLRIATFLFFFRGFLPPTKCQIHYSWLILFFYRNCEAECRSFSGLRFYPDTSAVSFHYLFGYCQADAGAGILRPAMKSLKNYEDAICKLRINADAVVLYRKNPFFFIFVGRYVNTGGSIAFELDSVHNQVLK